MTTDQPAPPRARRLSFPSGPFGAVIAMTLLIMIGFGIIVPALPRFAKEFGVGEFGVGVVVFAFSLTRLFGDVFAGTLIDRFGERPITAIGAAIVGVSSLTAGAAQSFTQLVVLRGAGGVGSALFLGGLMAFLIGTTPPEKRGRAMSVFQASFGLGFLIGPLIGGVLLAVSEPRVPLLVYGVVCLACVPLCLRALHGRTTSSYGDDTPPLLDEPPATRVRAWGRMRPLLGNKAYRAALAVSAVVFLIGQAQFTLVPLFWSDVLNQEQSTSGIPFAVASVLGLVVVWHAGAITDRRGRKSALVPALAVTVLATAALGFSGSALIFVALMGIGGAAGGYMRPGPSAIIADVSSPDTKGVAVSGFRIAGDLGALIGPLVAGYVAENISYGWAFASIAVFAAIAFVMTLVAEETAPGLSAR